MQRLLRQTPAWMTSMLVHIIAMLVMALLTIPEPIVEQSRMLLASTRLDPAVIVPDDRPERSFLPDFTEHLTAFGQELGLQPASSPTDLSINDVSGDDADCPPPELGLGKTSEDIVRAIPKGDPGGIARRSTGYEERSGTPEGRAVAAALKWLAAHQQADGAWSFAHQLAPSCQGKCRNPGELAEARIAATSLALLSFSGAGQTHKKGPYKETVKRGLYYLVHRMKVSPQGGSLLEPGGNMYSHGLASIVLCEAYAVTRDKGLFNPAQQALNFICYAQDPVGGGWRYQPRQRGDTSVVGWQIMALKSGHMAYLRVPPITVRKAFGYLDSVQANGGANYGYTDAGAGPATTAIGLLARMQLGWPKDHPALQRGVRWIAAQGPSKTDLYYNYYATQVMRHWGGEPWDQWDAVMRKHLLGAQCTAGHEQGSWCIAGDHGSAKGGRLYSTALAAMILEVYYRISPIYRQQSVEDSFPL